MERDGYAIVADLHGIAYHCKQGVPPARAQDERPQPLQLEPLREVLRRHACLGLPQLTSFGTLIDFVRFCARRWGDRHPSEASHYDLKRVKSVRTCAAHGSCLIDCFAEGGAARARRPAASPEGSPPWGSQGDQEEVDGEYGHAGGRDRARGALRLGTRGLLALARRIRASPRCSPGQPTAS